MIKKVLIAIGVLVALVVIVGLFLPATTHIERRVVIQSAPADVFVWVNSLKKFSEWSPWADLDPDMRIDFSGPDQGVGSSMRWQSEEQSVGSGSQSIIESVANESVVTRLDFGTSSPTQATWDLAPEGAAGTTLRWSLDVDHGFNLLSRYFGLMLDTWVGGQYDKGLATLKSRIESS